MTVPGFTSFKFHLRSMVPDQILTVYKLYQAEVPDVSQCIPLLYSASTISRSLNGRVNRG